MTKKQPLIIVFPLIYLAERPEITIFVSKFIMMEQYNVKYLNTNTKVYLCCFAWALVLLFFISPDSYTHDLHYRWDSAVFFSCGKAWMEGLLPYVDFADSKGPLLWLINGVAYLLSPYNYIGVFWLDVLSFSIVFYFDYKIANIFLRDERLSLLAVPLVSLAYFNPWYHFETSAEDWCQPMISVAFYLLCRVFYAEGGTDSRHIRQAAFWLGFAMMWTLLIKFSVTLMFGLTGCYFLYYLLKERLPVSITLLYFVFGLVSLALPFVVYLVWTGTFESFVFEYFSNTMATVQSENPLVVYVREWLRTGYDAYYASLFVVCVAGSVMLGRRMKKDGWFFLVSFMGFYALSIHHAIHRHYVNCCLFFALFFVIALLDMQREWLKKKALMLASVALLLLITLNFTYTEGYLVPNLLVSGNTAEKADYYKIGYYLSQVEKPTVIYYRFTDRGFGTLAGALPGSVYWHTQTGETEAMKKKQYEDALSARADFVFCYKSEENDSLFTSVGYVKQCDTHEFSLYGKQQPKPFPASFRVSVLDVLLKRNPFR